MRVLFVANTPFELYYLSSVGYLLRRARSDTHLRLLMSPNIERLLNPELASLYQDVQVSYFPGNPRAASWHALLRRLPYDVISSLAFLRQLKKLDLGADVICISSFREYFANILCRHPGNGPHLVALRMADESDHLCQVEKPFHAVFYNLLNRLFGISTMEYRWHPDTAYTTSRWYRNYPYQRTIYISDWGHGQNGTEYRLPPPFAALRCLYGIEDSSQQEKAILVAGERTPLYENWDAAAQALYEGFFDFLRQRFSGFRLLFKPRAGLTKVENLHLDGFEILPADISFEELCLRHSYRMVVSIKSTACKVAAYYGQPAYVLYPMFNFPPSIRESLDTYLADTRSIVRVRSLTDLLQEPSPAPTANIDELAKLYWEAIMEGTT